MVTATAVAGIAVLREENEKLAQENELLLQENEQLKIQNDELEEKLTFATTHDQTEYHTLRRDNELALEIARNMKLDWKFVDYNEKYDEKLRDEIKAFCETTDKEQTVSNYNQLYQYADFLLHDRAERFNDFLKFKEDMEKHGIKYRHDPKYEWAMVDMMVRSPGYKIAIQLAMKIKTRYNKITGQTKGAYYKGEK